MFQQLSDTSLLEAYENAKFLRLEQEFIEILESELVSRGILVVEGALKTS